MPCDLEREALLTGYEKMPRAVEVALPEIRAHMWTLYWLVRLHRSRAVVELGVRSGDSTRALLFGAQDVGGCKVQSYDIDGDAYRVGEVTANHGIPWPDGIEWGCSKSDSAEAGRHWHEGMIRAELPPPDLVFVDTDHTIETTRREIAAWSGLVIPGGCMVFHDIGLEYGVMQAIEEFLHYSPAGSWSLEEHQHVAPGDNGLGILWKAI